MRVDDLPVVAGWLSEAHVAEWWLSGSSIEREMEDLRRSVTGEQPVSVRVVIHEDGPIGWCQWYRCGDDPDWAGDIGAGPDDIGMDYGIGIAGSTRKGLGTLLVGEMVKSIRAEHPDVSIFADPDERNIASRRVLEKNGFELMTVKPIPSEPTDDPMAVYRLSPPVSASGR
ncbi:MAG TPA: GNAT family N-acetyltransferase [Acidimicrobiales bacterium]|nr:GNAT family N-acetyltransferase [Acidimicrobiales bacterium]